MPRERLTGHLEMMKMYLAPFLKTDLMPPCSSWLVLLFPSSIVSRPERRQEKRGKEHVVTKKREFLREIQPVPTGNLRRNVVLRGVSKDVLNDAIGHTVKLGPECLVFVHRLCVPCMYNEKKNAR